MLVEQKKIHDHNFDKVRHLFQWRWNCEEVKGKYDQHFPYPEQLGRHLVDLLLFLSHFTSIFDMKKLFNFSSFTFLQNNQVQW